MINGVDQLGQEVLGLYLDPENSSIVEHGFDDYTLLWVYELAMQCSNHVRYLEHTWAITCWPDF